MSPKQKLEIRASEIRGKLAELAGVEELTDEQRAEVGTLRTEYSDVETKIQAATVASDEPEPERRERTMADDPEARELAELRGKIRMGNYVAAAIEMRAADGAEAEFNQHSDIGAHRFPLELLAPPAPAVEQRAVTGTDIAVMPHTWLDRLFADTAAMRLGITFESVPAGSASFPVTTAGATYAQREKEATIADAAWTVGVTELKPFRGGVRAVFTSEDAARVPGLEDGLNRDLRAVLMEGVDRAIFLGADAGSANNADIVGLLAAANVVEKTLTQAHKVNAANTFGAFVDLMDGKHATMLSDLRVVAAEGAGQLWEKTVLSVSSETASVFKTLASFLRENGLSWSIRSDLETATSNGKFGAFVGRSRGIAGAAVAPVWNAGELIRDPYTKAATGEVALTLAYLWNFALVRPSNFARVKFVT